MYKRNYIKSVYQNYIIYYIILCELLFNGETQIRKFHRHDKFSVKNSLSPETMFYTQYNINVV